MGLFVGLLIPMSIQLIIALPLAFLFRLSAITAGIGTFITNPWSVIIIYPIQLYVGRWILTFQCPQWADVKETCSQFIHVAGNVKLTEWNTYKPLFEMGWDELILPFFTAGALFGVIAAVFGYYFTKRLVLLYRSKAQERKRKRHQKIKSNIVQRKIKNETTD